MLLSDRLRWLRKRFDYSQASLADALSISRMAYTQYESGHREPSLDTLIQLARIYNVSLDFLLGLSDFFRPPQHTFREGYLLSQLDRLTEERRHKVFHVLQHELGEQILYDASIYPKSLFNWQSHPADSKEK
jgi:transcriptional regulator with XRE-family HTH domain